MLKSQFTDQKFVKVVIEFHNCDGKNIKHVTRWPGGTKVIRKIQRLCYTCKRLGFTHFKICLEKCRAVSSLQRVGGSNGIRF